VEAQQPVVRVEHHVCRPCDIERRFVYALDWTHLSLGAGLSFSVPENVRYCMSCYKPKAGNLTYLSSWLSLVTARFWGALRSYLIDQLHHFRVVLVNFI
jgi:hypothetical protein